MKLMKLCALPLLLAASAQAKIRGARSLSGNHEDRYHRLLGMPGNMPNQGGNMPNQGGGMPGNMPNQSGNNNNQSGCGGGGTGAGGSRRRRGRMIMTGNMGDGSMGRMGRMGRNRAISDGNCVPDHYCGTVRGDPHIYTWDNLKYDCQAGGEFVLARSLETTFEIQGRFVKPGSDKPVSVTKAIAMDTGVDGAPGLDIYVSDTNGVCSVSVFLDGVEASFNTNGQAVAEDCSIIEGVELMAGVAVGESNVDYIYFSESGILVSSVCSYHDSFGSFLNTKICIPKDMVEGFEAQTLVGLWGTPNNNMADDWMATNGTTLTRGNLGVWQENYEYCTTEWCVDESETIFGYEDGVDSWATYHKCDEAYSPMCKNLVDGASTLCVNCCSEGNPDPEDFTACLVECANGDLSACGIDKKNKATMDVVEQSCPNTQAVPTSSPTDAPTSDPTVSPTDGPTASPTDGPTGTPTKAPTDGPTGTPTKEPTDGPTGTPTKEPTDGPTGTPTRSPTDSPTETPTIAPTDPPAPDAGDRSFTTDEAPTYVKGDPHFKTFSGEYYDFHGECDLVLLHNPNFKNGLGMDVHIRTKIEDFWSSVESAAVQIGDGTLEIRASPESDEWLWINGTIAPGSTNNQDHGWHRSSIGGFLVRYKQSSPAVREAVVYIEQGHKEKIYLKTFKSFVRVEVDSEGSSNYGGSLGLLGSWDKDGLRVGRDGETFIKNAHRFGQEWKVRDDEPKLFHSYKGAIVGPECKMPPKYTPEAAAKIIKRRLAESGMTTEDAEQACSHLRDPEEVKSCVFDVLATQDLGMAAAW